MYGDNAISMSGARRDSLSGLPATHWDMLIVGGGISGAGILLEAQKNGLKAALIEQTDFAWGTSSRSSKMVHGGIKYLSQGQPVVTIKSVKERQKLLDQLPGLVDRLDLNYLNYKSEKKTRFILRLGLFVYDVLAGGLRKHYLSRDYIEQQAPALRLEELDCSYTFFESVTDDARLTLRVLQEARACGGLAVNYCRANGVFVEGDCVAGVDAEDVISGEKYRVKAKMVVNATGAWADQLRAAVNTSAKERIRPLRGSHLIFRKDKFPIGVNVTVPHPRDGRPVFAFEWEGRICVGSTDIDHGRDMSEEAVVSPEEMAYILEFLNFYYPGLCLNAGDVVSSWSGVRPVIDSGAADPSKESRDHFLALESGLLTITGGKLTTFRTMAEEVVRSAAEYLEKPFVRTRHAFPPAQPIDVQTDLPFGEGMLTRLNGRYGPEVFPFLKECTSDLLQSVEDTQTIWAEFIWAMRCEQVVHLDDLLLRRTRVGLLLEGGGESILERLEHLCRMELGWATATWEQERARYLSIWRRYYSTPEVAGMKGS